jgi:hypothetical protein
MPSVSDEACKSIPHNSELALAQTDLPDPSVEPSSAHFSATSWFAAIQSIKQKFPSKYPSKAFGLSFRNLRAYGHNAEDNVQPTFGGYALQLVRAPSRMLKRSRSRIEILDSIDGVVQQGEMLLVLGRPGSGCTTLLKSLTGKSRGFVVGNESSINYQGSKSHFSILICILTVDYRYTISIHVHGTARRRRIHR